MQFYAPTQFFNLHYFADNAAVDRTGVTAQRSANVYS